MLTITIYGEEYYNEKTETFHNFEDVVLELEHSLASLSKWESKHQKPFLDGKEKTSEEIQDYIRCMVLTPNYDPEVLSRLNSTHYKAINDYMESSHSATTFNSMANRGPRSRETITSELIYYWMSTAQIPFECESWHLNRLFNLLKIASLKSSPQKKMSQREVAARNRELNAKRRAELGTSG